MKAKYLFFLFVAFVYLTSCDVDTREPNLDEKTLRPQQILGDSEYKSESYNWSDQENNSTFDVVANSSLYSTSRTLTYSWQATPPSNTKIKNQKTPFDPTKKKTTKIIKDGDVSIKTKNLVGSKKDFDKILKKLEGYYQKEELVKETEVIYYTLKIRVPAKNFEKLLAFISSGNDEITRKNINSRDVTDQFLDIESRLENKRAYLQRYKELLSKASSVGDILEIEEKIRNLQEEIESKEGQLQYLQDQVEFSTLNIYLFKEIVQEEENHEDTFFSRVVNSLIFGWKSVVDFLLWLVAKWPMIVIMSILFFVGRSYWRKRKKRKEQSN